ncbi:MAG: hypothetical protein ACM3WV_08655 [Bacillota bacterium]
MIHGSTQNCIPLLKKGLIRLVFISLMICGIPSRAFDLNVSPSNFDLAVRPGGVYNGHLWVNGSPDRALQIRGYAQDWYLKSTGEMVCLQPNSLKRSAAGWIRFEPANFVIPAGGRQKVKFTVTVPENAEGGYWSLIFFQTVQAAPKNKTALTISGRLGVTFHIATGNPVAKVQLNQLKLSWNLSKRKITGTVKLSNVGNVLLHYQGRLEIRDLSNKIVARTVIQKSAVLPESYRTISLVCSGGPLPRGKYMALAIIDYGGDHLAGAQAILEI